MVPEVLGSTPNPSWANIVRKPVDSHDGFKGLGHWAHLFGACGKSGARQDDSDYAMANSKAEVGDNMQIDKRSLNFLTVARLTRAVRMITPMTWLRIGIAVALTLVVTGVSLKVYDNAVAGFSSTAQI